MLKSLVESKCINIERLLVLSAKELKIDGNELSYFAAYLYFNGSRDQDSNATDDSKLFDVDKS